MGHYTGTVRRSAWFCAVQDALELTGLGAPCRKKYSIERKDGEKILSRKSGFTVNTCVTGTGETDESAVLRRLTGSDKVRLAIS
jgi:hypothetical protein